MAVTTYQHCYRILRAPSDCDWKELRLAYRRRVRLCHPDILSPDTANDPGRDDEFKQVVIAYRLLARFRQRHGELPPPWLAVMDAAVVAIPPRAPLETPAGAPAEDAPPPVAGRTRAFPWLPPFHRAVLVAFICGVSSAALVEHPQNDDRANAGSGTGHLAVGMDPESVVSIHGVPSYTKGSVWFYGDSGVIFDRGCVVGWENQPPYPLRTLVTMRYFSGRLADSGHRADCMQPGD